MIKRSSLSIWDRFRISPRLWNDLRQGFTTKKAQALYQKLFSAFEPQLRQIDTLYLALDGFLNMVAFARLVLPDGQYWFQRQALRQIDTGRDLITSPSLAHPQGFVAFGGMDYDHYGAQDAPSAPLPEAAATAAETRAWGRYLAEHIPLFKPLSASGPEATEIAESFWDYAGSRAVVFRGADASEAQLKSLKTPPRVLHLATHGFYLPREGMASERPMALSGLALAGANRGMRGELNPSGEDGILYALEAQNLNLEGTELIALSACDTAKGVVDYSDGVYGLRRAFRIAGAKNVLMTLWPVGDASARVFMQTFYRHWFSQGMSDAALALQKTRHAFLQHRTIAWRDSQVWAPFVLVESR